MAVQLTNGDCIGALFIFVLTGAFRIVDLHTAGRALGVW